MRRTILSMAMIDKAREYLESGVPQSQTFRALGISEAAWYEWQKKGRALLDAGLDSESDDDALTENDRLYMEFAGVVESSRARCMKKSLDIIRKAAKKDWRAAAWYLERGFPQDFGRGERDNIQEATETVNIYVPDNGKVKA